MTADTPTRAEIRGLRHELAVAEAEIEQLRAENKQLRQWLKDDWERSTDD